MDATFDSIDEVILSVYDTLSGEFGVMVTYGQAIGLLGALCYVFYRIWENWSQAQPIPVFPLLRPIALALLLLFYPAFVGGIKQIADSVERGTASIGDDKAAEINKLAFEIEEARTKYYLDKIAQSKADPSVGQYLANASGLGALTDYISLGFSNIGDSIKQFVLFIFECFFVAARLMIKAFSVFFTIILFLFGPIVIGLACFDWFYSSLPGYVGKIINLLLWAPISNIIVYMLRVVQVNVMERTLTLYSSQVGNEYTSFDFAMIVFYIMGTACFLMIPTIASWLIQGVSGAGAGLSSMGGAGVGVASVAGASAGKFAGGRR